MESQETLTITVTDYIQRLSKELNIQGTKGVFGNELELIALVRNCQFLYDRSLPDFKNIQKKNEAWEAIASVFGVSVGEVQQRWKGMRDLFNKKSKNDTPTKHVCPYYEDLKFLEPYIVGRRRMSMSLTDTQQSEDDDSGKEKEPTPQVLEDIVQFINRIKSEPILYHHKYSGHSFSKHKVEVWMQISQDFGIPVKECLSRWKNLRERFSRERRLQQSGVTIKKWTFYDHLTFLNQHVKTRRRFQRVVPSSSTEQKLYIITSPSNSSSEPVTIDSNFLNSVGGAKKESPLEDVEFFDVSSDIPSSPGPLFNEDNTFSDQSQDDSTSPSQQSKRPVDEDYLFGQTVAAELKKLPCPRKKIKLKAEIYRLIYEHSCE